ncbi:MAG: CehA/McbA family metallohydrolase [Lachnospiraceae bacterium]
MEQTLTYSIHDKADSIQVQSFEVHAEAAAICMDVEVPELCRYMGFVILQDPRGEIRLQKLLGYAAQKLGVGHSGYETSVGGVPGSIWPGTWKLTLGIFTEYVQQKLRGEAAEIHVSVTDQPQEVTDPVGEWIWTAAGRCEMTDTAYDWEAVYAAQPGWYKGDFHTHTTLSDGKETTRSAMQKARQMGLDFYVPTEHNLMHTGWCERDLCVLPGTEITTERGHFNLFGVTKQPEHLYELIAGDPVRTQSCMQAVMQEARRRGWLISLNHPFLTIWSWRYEQTRLDAFDCIEIINDPTYPQAAEANDRTLRFIDALWQDGHRIYGVGGSDSHNLIDELYEGAATPSIPGDPATYVYCNKLSPAELLRQVKQGHMCVTRFCQIHPVITMNGSTYLPGDELIIEGKAQNILSYFAKITGLTEEPVVQLIVNGQAIPVALSKRASGSYEAAITLSLSLTEWTWIRLEVRGQDGGFLGYTNPVYYGQKTPDYWTFGEITQQMGEE